MQAKFRTICDHCKIVTKPGDEIYKVNDHWCSNQQCPNPKTILDSNPQDPILPEYAKLHFEIWKFAYASAEKIHSGKDFETSKSRNILAQVFYKKCFDAKIHLSKKDSRKN